MPFLDRLTTLQKYRKAAGRRRRVERSAARLGSLINRPGANDPSADKASAV
jgi:hypothetical protein